MQDLIDENKLIHSSDRAILDIVETLQNNMDKHYFSLGVFLDLKKGFWFCQSQNTAWKT